MPRVAESSRAATMLRSAAASEPSMVDCADAMFLFRGHPGRITVDIDDTAWVSDSLSGPIWHVASDGTPTPVLSPAVSRHLAGHGAAPLAPAGLASAPGGEWWPFPSHNHRSRCLLSGCFWPMVPLSSVPVGAAYRSAVVQTVNYTESRRSLIRT